MRALGGQTQREAVAITVLMVLGDDGRGSIAQAQALCVSVAAGHMAFIQADFRHVEVIFTVAIAIRQLGLANVVQQGAHAQVEHVGLAQPEIATHEQRKHAHVDGMVADAVARRLAKQLDAHFLGTHHLDDQASGQALGDESRFGGFGRHMIKDPPG